MTARAKAAGTPRTMSAKMEETLRQDVFDSELGGALDGDDCKRLFAELDAERALSAELAAALENMQRAAVLLHNHIAANTDYSEVLVQSCYADARAALAKARGERRV